MSRYEVAMAASGHRFPQYWRPLKAEGVDIQFTEVHSSVESTEPVHFALAASQPLV